MELRLSAALFSCMIALTLVGCARNEPLVAAVPVTSKQTPVTDQAVIAETVGRGSIGSDPLAWANPSTGSAGVIERIDAGNDGAEGCRRFVTSKQTLETTTRFDGMVCPSGESWKISGPSN